VGQKIDYDSVGYEREHDEKADMKEEACSTHGPEREGESEEK